MSRQEKRRELWKFAVKQVNQNNLHPVVNNAQFTGLWRGMLRRERRKLAKAYFKAGWMKRNATA